MRSPGVILSLCVSTLTLLSLLPQPVTPKKGSGNNNGGGDKETKLKDVIVCKTCLYIEAKETADTVQAGLISSAEFALNKAFEVGTSTKICINKPKEAKSKTTEKKKKKIPMCITWKGEFMDKKIELRFGIPIDPDAKIKTRSGKTREVADGDCTGSVEGLGFPSGVDDVTSQLSDMDICLCNNDDECNDGRGGSSALKFQLIPLILPTFFFLTNTVIQIQ